MSKATPVTEIFSSIQGEGMLAGYRQIFIRFPVCNLACRYCDTVLTASSSCVVHPADPAALQVMLPQPVRQEDVLTYVHEQCQRYPHLHHSISITGGEPLLHDEVLADWLPALNVLLPIHLETNGTLPDALARLITHIDFVSMDIKLPSNAEVKPAWDAHRRFLEIGLERDISVKMVVSDRTSHADMLKAVTLIADCDPEIPVFLQPETTPQDECAISQAALFQLQGIAAKHLDDVRVIPQFHRYMGIR